MRKQIITILFAILDTYELFVVHTSYTEMNNEMEYKLKEEYVFEVLGGGTMGTAVLNAVSQAVSKSQNPNKFVAKPSKFITSIASTESVKRLRKQFGSKVSVMISDNSKLVENFNVIILGCKPYMLERIVGSIPNELFKSKIIVSLLGGKTIEQTTQFSGNNALVVRAMTNTPSSIGAGMTALSYPEGVSEDIKGSIDWIFNQTDR